MGLWCGYLGAFAAGQRMFSLLDRAELLRIRWSDLWFIVVGIACQLVVTIAYAPFHIHNFSGPTHKIFGGSSCWSFLVLGIITVTIVPLLEELFFRGLMVRSLWSILRVKSTAVTAALVIGIDGLIFAAAHGEWVQTPGLAALGAFLAYIFLRTGRLAPNVLTHASFNSVALVVLTYQRARSS